MNFTLLKYVFTDKPGNHTERRKIMEKKNYLMTIKMFYYSSLSGMCIYSTVQLIVTAQIEFVV